MFSKGFSPWIDKSQDCVLKSYLQVIYDLYSSLPNGKIWDQSNLKALILQAAFWPFPKRQILDVPKPRGYADDNFKFDKNG